jgi:hypothetical protein
MIVYDVPTAQPIRWELLNEQAQALDGLRGVNILGEGTTAQAVRFILGDGSQSEYDDCAAILAAHNPADKTGEEQLIDWLRTQASSAVGVLVTDLTAAQQRAVIGLVLYRLGAIDEEGRVRPLDLWT